MGKAFISVFAHRLGLVRWGKAGGNLEEQLQQCVRDSGTIL